MAGGGPNNKPRACWGHAGYMSTDCPLATWERPGGWTLIAPHTLIPKENKRCTSIFFREVSNSWNIEQCYHPQSSWMRPPPPRHLPEASMSHFNSTRCDSDMWRTGPEKTFQFASCASRGALVPCITIFHCQPCRNTLFLAVEHNLLIHGVCRRRWLSGLPMRRSVLSVHSLTWLGDHSLLVTTRFSLCARKRGGVLQSSTCCICHLHNTHIKPQTYILSFFLMFI